MKAVHYAVSYTHLDVYKRQIRNMLIKNGRVIDPESGFDGLADLLIEDGKIKKIVKRVDGGADNTVPERVTERMKCWMHRE